MQDDPVLSRFLEHVRLLGPKVKTVYLFGSRARGTDRPDSDYDLLLVTAGDFSLQDKDALYDAVLAILLDTGRLVSLKIFREQEFQRLSDMGTPFMTHVQREGIRVG